MDYGTQMGLATGLNEGLNNFLKTYMQMRQLKNDEQRLMQQQQFQQMQAEDMGLLRGAQRRRIEQEIEQNSPEVRERALQIQIEKENRQFERDKELAKIKNQGALDLIELKNKGLISGISMRNQGAVERAQMGMGAAMQMNQDRLAAQKEIESLKAQNKEVPQGLLSRANAPAMPMKQPTGDQFKAAGFARRLEQSEDVFSELEKSGYNRATRGQQILSMLPGEVQGENLRKQQQAERNFVNAVLRRESGAAISPAEFQSAEQQYFPRPGDTPEVLQQKKANRLQVTKSLEGEGGPALGLIPKVEMPRKAAQQSAQGMSEEDMAALQWAQSNPRDPRAAQILKQLGQ